MMLQMQYLEGPEGSSDWDEGCASEPDEACRQPIWACIMRQLSIPLRMSQPGSCAGSKESSQACARTHHLEVQRKLNNVTPANPLPDAVQYMSHTTC